MIDLAAFILGLAGVAALAGACLWAIFAAMHQLLVWTNEFIDIFKNDEDDAV